MNTIAFPLLRRGIFLMVLSLSIQCSYSPPSRPMLTIRDISVPDGSLVDSTTIIAATVSYRIPGFDPNSRTYDVVLMFQNTVGGTFSVPPNDRVLLTSPDSVVRFHYGLQKAWNTRNIARPFIVTFVLMEGAKMQQPIRISDRMTLVGPKTPIATSTPIRFVPRK